MFAAEMLPPLAHSSTPCPLLLFSLECPEFPPPQLNSTCRASCHLRHHFRNASIMTLFSGALVPAAQSSGKNGALKTYKIHLHVWLKFIKFNRFHFQVSMCRFAALASQRNRIFCALIKNWNVFIGQEKKSAKYVGTFVDKKKNYKWVPFLQD